MDMALGIGDSNLRTQALKNVAREWFWKAPTAATQWINSSALRSHVFSRALVERLYHGESSLEFIIDESSITTFRY